MPEEDETQSLPLAQTNHFVPETITFWDLRMQFEITDITTKLEKISANE